jgi:hypothetical protein
MGNSVSTQDVATVPLQREPVPDGTSGLHYSGRVYMNEMPKLATGLCAGVSAGADQIGDLYDGGVSTADLPTDDGTKRVGAAALQGYIQGLVSKGAIPGSLGSFKEQADADKAFYATVQEEYCFYEARYVAALSQFLSQIADARGTDTGAAQRSLTQTVALNRRLNSLLEIINYVGNDRAQKVNARTAEIEKANTDIQAKIATLQEQKDFLESGDVRVRTQQEMMRYSAEKNRAMNIQIMFFVALNVVALGAVLSIYKSTGTRPL